MKFRNAAIATTDALLQEAVDVFCVSPVTKSFGQITLSVYSPATLAGYVKLMGRYRQFLADAKSWSFPISDHTWQAILLFRPSLDSQQAFVRAKACWALFCKLNMLTFPTWVSMTFDGYAKRMLPVRKPKQTPEEKPREEIMQSFMDIAEHIEDRMGHFVLMASLLAYYGNMRASDSVRLTQNSVQFDVLGLIISPNTKKNDKLNNSYHQIFLPYSATPGHLDVGSLFELSYRTVKTKALFIFTKDDGGLMAAKQLMDGTRNFFKKHKLQPISAKEYRKLGATNLLKNNSADTVDVICGWRSRMAQSFYINTNKQFRFDESAKL